MHLILLLGGSQRTTIAQVFHVVSPQMLIKILIVIPTGLLGQWKKLQEQEIFLEVAEDELATSVYKQCQGHCPL